MPETQRTPARGEGGAWRGRSNGAAPSHAARAHAQVRLSRPTLPLHLSAKGGRGLSSHVGRASGNAHARRTGGPREPALSAGSRAHALTAGGRASRGRRPSPGLVGGKGGCRFSVACLLLSGHHPTFVPKACVHRHGGNLAGGRSQSACCRCLQNEWSE